MSIEAVVRRLRNAHTVGVLTGAGISAASGVPTFRGKNGLWRNYRPEELATFSAFQRNPHLVWEWYLWRRSIIRKVQPNAAHYALKELEEILPNLTIITQNVDNLHQLAGSRKVIELHGNIMRSRCSRCGKPYPEEVDLREGIPTCQDCGGLIRPDVVWFGEFLPPQSLEQAQQVARNSEVFFSVGTSAVVEPAASLPYLAKTNGAFLVEINPEQTPLTPQVDLYFQDSADKILPEILRQLKENSKRTEQ